MINRLEAWVADCQSGMYVNCVYCGHRYGPQDKVPAARADILKQHIEACPDHPMSALKTENTRLRAALAAIVGLIGPEHDNFYYGEIYAIASAAQQPAGANGEATK